MDEERDVWKPPSPLTPEEREKAAEDFNNAVKRIQSTSGHKKIMAYFEEIVKTDFVQSRAAEMRKLFSYPADGLSKKEADHTYGSAWKSAQDKEKLVALDKIIREICAKFSLHYMDWKDALQYYLFTGKIDLILNYLAEYNLFQVADLAEERAEPFGKDFQKSDDAAFPIAIRMSPYASLRDIIDFVRKAYKANILPMQMAYRDKNITLGKVRPKRQKVSLRNDFIYQNRHLPRKKIKHLVENKFGELLEYTHIAKIISLENKKRKGV